MDGNLVRDKADRIQLQNNLKYAFNWDVLNGRPQSTGGKSWLVGIVIAIYFIKTVYSITFVENNRRLTQELHLSIILRYLCGTLQFYSTTFKGIIVLFT